MSERDALVFWLSSQGAYTGVPTKMREEMLRALHELAAERQRADGLEREMVRAVANVNDRALHYKDRAERLEAALREIAGVLWFHADAGECRCPSCLATAALDSISAAEIEFTAGMTVSNHDPSEPQQGEVRIVGLGSAKQTRSNCLHSWSKTMSVAREIYLCANCGDSRPVKQAE